ncbi:unnamed protein product [Durusdinium trenchii]|uniref:Uncharacterized protein n=2 Tax=Durusdinium trenchii TaxID=1381693 RepID=A0ABP0IUF2_9DINO
MTRMLHVALFLGVWGEAQAILRGPRSGEEVQSHWEGMHRVLSRVEASLSGLFAVGKDPANSTAGLPSIAEGSSVRTQILSINNGSNATNLSTHQSIQTQTNQGNVTVEIESRDVTLSNGNASSPKAKVIAPPLQPSKDDFVVQIRSVERVDGKKPIKPNHKSSKKASETDEIRKASAREKRLDIEVRTVTETPQTHEVPAARREYNSKMWADDWGDEWRSSARSPETEKKELPVYEQSFRG